MRHARLKPDDRDTWHHCYNRAVGTSEDRPFDHADKEQFVRVLHRVAAFYAVRIVAYQVMSNHWHILLQAPLEPPSEEETARRFEAFHHGKRTLQPGSKLCRDWQGRLRDVSWCMRHLQHLYTAWYNRTRPVRRRGPLWAGRFKNTLLESGTALWACWRYIERNPVRAGMVTDPADYRFCSYGVWAQTGRHPFAEALSEVLIPALPDGLNGLDAKALRAELREAFARSAAEEAPKQPEQAAADTDRVPLFTLSTNRRVRHWVDGLVIGSELFVRETMSRLRKADGPTIARHRLTPAADASGAFPTSAPICCWQAVRRSVG